MTVVKLNGAVRDSHPNTRAHAAATIREQRSVEFLDLGKLARGHVHRLQMAMFEGALGRPWQLPLIVVRGARPGPVFGLTAAVHGNELNGIRVIHRLLPTIDPAELVGDLVAVPAVNVPGLYRFTRDFEDGKDLNRLMPGLSAGSPSQMYAHRLFDRVVRHFDYLIDLHTAAFGRVNSLYARANMRDSGTAELARRLRPEIIVHNEGGDGTLRAAAAARGVRAVTLEVGDPQRFQSDFISGARIGVRDAMEHLGMVPADDEWVAEDAIECSRSFWLYADRGGLLHVLPMPGDKAKKGEQIARIHDIYGERVRTYACPLDGVVVGRSTNPIATPGSRILHVGVLGRV